MTKKTFPTIADIKFAIIASFGGYASVKYNQENNTFTVTERVPTLVKHPCGIEYYKGYRISICTMTFKEGYDTYYSIYGK